MRAALRLSIPGRVFLGFSTVLAAFGLVTVFELTSLRHVDAELELVGRPYHQLTRLVALLESSYRSSEQATGRLLEETDASARVALLMHATGYQPRVARQKIASARSIVAALRRKPAPGDLAFLDRVDGLLSALNLRYDRYVAQGLLVRHLIHQVERAPPPQKAQAEAKLEQAMRALKAIEQGIGEGIKDLSGELDTRINLRVQQIGHDEQESAFLVLVFSLVAVLVGLLVTALAQRTLSPIRRLTEAVKDVGEGRFFQKLPVERDDELGLLARELNAMAKKLAERDKQLSEKNQELLRSARLAAVGKLAAQITHEIRNPLSSLSLNAELLEDQLKDGAFADQEAHDEARVIVASMGREVDRLAEITEEYLRFARLPKPQLATVDLNDEVEELTDFLAEEMARSKVNLDRELAKETPLVRADASQVRQVLLNLLRNAREATGEDGHVLVLTRVEAGHSAALLEVRDDGPGIAEEQKAQLFEPFFSTKERGTGLGLALVQQIVHDHGGAVVCESAPGQGTRMIVTLPLAPSSTDVAPPPEEPSDVVQRAR